MPSVWVEKVARKKGHSHKVYWEIDGTRSSKTFRSKAVADSYAGKKRIEVEAGIAGVEILHAAQHWEEFASEYLIHCRHEKAHNTVENFDAPAIESFTAIVGNLPLTLITPQLVEKWKAQLFTDDYGAWTVAMRVRCLRTAFNYARRMRLVSSNPVSGVSIPKGDPVGHAMTDEEIQDLYARASEGLRRMAMFSLNTGCRLGEVLGLTWRDILETPDGPVLELQPAGRKTRKPCRIPLNAGALAALGLAQGGKKGEPGAHPFVYSRSGVQHDVMRFGIRYHDTRHTFITRYLESGGSPLDLLEMGVVTSLDTLKRYSHISARVLRDRMAALKVPNPHLTSPLKQEGSGSASTSEPS